jgi:hypothetical protein
MTVRMKNHSKKVLPFPKSPAKPESSRIVMQIGNERFAINWEIEELPPAAPLIVLKRRAKKVEP